VEAVEEEDQEEEEEKEEEERGKEGERESEKFCSRVQITCRPENFGSRKPGALFGLFWRHRGKVILDKMLLLLPKFSG
jgi:hypothetical protein